MKNLIGVRATIPCRDLDAAMTWYADKLGIKPTEQEPQGAFYEVGDSKFLLYPSQFAGTNEATAATFEVTDVEAVVADLKGHAVVFEEYDLPDFKTEDSIASAEGFRGAWFKDPDGNIIALAERLA
jgi:catechol 2,3-dioxygenase-like lactoylglutathione lyase family enzyme